jgi:hypothetical protein
MYYIMAFFLWTVNDSLSPTILLAFGTIRRLRHIAHELWQIRVPRHLPYGVGLAQVHPVVIDIPQEHRANALDARLTLRLQMGL